MPKGNVSRLPTGTKKSKPKLRKFSVGARLYIEINAVDEEDAMAQAEAYIDAVLDSARPGDDPNHEKFLGVTSESFNTEDMFIDDDDEEEDDER